MNIWISLSFQSLRNEQVLKGLAKFIPRILNAVECYRIKKLGDTKKARSSDACAVIIITFPKIGSKYFGNSRFKNSNQRANENNHSTFYWLIYCLADSDNFKLHIRYKQQQNQWWKSTLLKSFIISLAPLLCGDFRGDSRLILLLRCKKLLQHRKVITLWIAYVIFSNRFSKNSLLLPQQNMEKCLYRQI